MGRHPSPCCPRRRVSLARPFVDWNDAIYFNIKILSIRAQVAKAKPLTLLPLITIIFFEVSGGPFGTEDAVLAAGPLLCLLGFLIMPLVWSVPEALITAELSTAFPENSGYVAWVTAAFGPFWGFQEGLWSWISGVADNSLYPVMLAANLEIFFPQLSEGWPRTTFLISLSLFLSYLNYRGLVVVGHAMVTSIVGIVLPFAVLCLLCIPRINPRNWIKVDWDTVDWLKFFNVQFWNLNYWDACSTLAGEVDDPARTFPRAMLSAVLLVAGFYIIPTLAALGITTDTSDWSLGFYSKVADMVGGKWLALWIVVAAVFSQVGQFQAEMASDSYQVQGMAERGFLPKFLAYRSSYDTPTLGILASSLGIFLMSSFKFVEIIEMLNAVYALSELLEFAAFIWLRIKEPDLPRPYKIPLPTWALCIMIFPATALLIFILVIPIFTGDTKNVVCTVGAIVIGFTLWPLLQVARRRGWCEFEPLHPNFWKTSYSSLHRHDRLSHGPSMERPDSPLASPLYSGPVPTALGADQDLEGLVSQEEQDAWEEGSIHQNLLIEAVCPGYLEEYEDAVEEDPVAHNEVMEEDLEQSLLAQSRESHDIDAYSDDDS